MTGDEIKALRRTLDWTARKLGEALGIDQGTVLAWEREDLFPTKRHVAAMGALLERSRAAGGGDEGSGARGGGETGGARGGGERSGARGGGERSGARGGGETGGSGSEARGGDAAVWGGLADPAVWRLFRKVLASEELRAEVERLAERFPDPADD